MKSFNVEKEKHKIVPFIRLLYLVNAFFRHGECSFILLLLFQTRAECILYAFVWSSQKLQAQDINIYQRENCRHSFLLPAIAYVSNCIACTKCCMEKTPAKRIVYVLSAN